MSIAEYSLNRPAEAFRGTDFSTLDAAHEQSRELDRSIEQDREITRDRDDVFSL